MIVISIGTERKLFSENSTRERILNMGKDFEQYHLIVFSLAKDTFKQQVIGNAILYPTNSYSKIGYVWDAIKIAYRITKLFSRNEKNNTVITAQDPFECGFVGFIVSRLQKIKLHIQIHTDIFSLFFKNTRVQYIRMLIAPIIIYAADAIRCDCKRMANIIMKKKMSRAPVAILPIFIDVKKYDLSQQVKSDVHDLFQEKRFVILMASRLEPEKEISMAIDVFAKIITTYPKQAGLVIVGSGSLEQNLKNQVKEIGLERDVLFVPWVNDLQSYYKTADLFWMTSRFEGYGLTIAESLLCNTPVLTSDVGVAPEIIITDKTGWICPSQNSVCFEKKLNMIIGDRATYQAIKQYLVQHPYVHAYADMELYKKAFIENIASAIVYKQPI